MRRVTFLVAALAAAAFALPRAVVAQANLEINTPAINALQRSMQQRHTQLAPLYSSGAVGFTHDGSIALRDLNGSFVAETAKPAGSDRPWGRNTLVADESGEAAAVPRRASRPADATPSPDSLSPEDQ